MLKDQDLLSRWGQVWSLAFLQMLRRTQLSFLGFAYWWSLPLDKLSFDQGITRLVEVSRLQSYTSVPGLGDPEGGLKASEAPHLASRPREGCSSP